MTYRPGDIWLEKDPVTGQYFIWFRVGGEDRILDGPWDSETAANRKMRACAAWAHEHVALGA